MKPLLSLFLGLFLISASAQSQNEYLKDLISLRKILEKTVSYKHQIRGQALEEYDQLFEQLKADSGALLGSQPYFYRLTQLFFPIQDNHLAFYQVGKFTNPADFPTFRGNLDSLSAVCVDQQWNPEPGELFSLQLKTLPHVKILGQTSKGMLTYGSNYGKREKLQSQAFEVYLTDMYGAKKFLPYENYGISPDIALTNSRDWIEQALQYIAQQQ